MKKNDKKSKFSSVVLFPERVNNVFLFLIVILFFGVVILLDACVLFNKDYNYEPQYEEVKYTEWVNPYIRVFNNYVYESEKIVTKYRVVGCYYGKKTTNYIIDYRIDTVMITSENEYIYKGDDTINTTKTNTKTDYLLNNDIVEGIIEKIYYKFTYTKYEDGYRTKNMTITNKEEIISLSKQEIDSEYSNNFSDVSDIIIEYEVKKQKDETKTTISSNLSLNTTNNSEYHIDFQLFGIDENDEIYNLIGYYNLGNNTGNLLNHETTITNKIILKDVIVKCKIVDEEHGERTVFMKKSFDDLVLA